MKKYIIDTNALISFVTDRDIDQQKSISVLFEEGAKLRVLLLCPQNVITEFVYVLDKIYTIPKTKINNMIHDLIMTPGLKIIHELSLEALLDLWPRKIPDFDDAVITSLCLQHKGSIVATFDKSLCAILKKIKIPTI